MNINEALKLACDALDYAAGRTQSMINDLGKTDVPPVVFETLGKIVADNTEALALCRKYLAGLYLADREAQGA